MANTTIALTRKQIRQSISRLLSINSPYAIVADTVSSFVTNTGVLITTTDLTIDRLKAVPPTDTSLFVGSLVYITSGVYSGSQPYYVTAFTPSTGTLTVYPAIPSGVSTTPFPVEIYDPRKWSKDQ